MTYQRVNELAQEAAAGTDLGSLVVRSDGTAVLGDIPDRFVAAETKLATIETGAEANTVNATLPAALNVWVGLRASLPGTRDASTLYFIIDP